MGMSTVPRLPRYPPAIRQRMGTRTSENEDVRALLHPHSRAIRSQIYLWVPIVSVGGLILFHSLVAIRLLPIPVIGSIARGTQRLNCSMHGSIAPRIEQFSR